MYKLIFITYKRQEKEGNNKLHFAIRTESSIVQLKNNNETGNKVNSNITQTTKLFLLLPQNMGSMPTLWYEALFKETQRRINFACVSERMSVRKYAHLQSLPAQVFIYACAPSLSKSLSVRKCACVRALNFLVCISALHPAKQDYGVTSTTLSGLKTEAATVAQQPSCHSRQSEW